MLSRESELRLETTEFSHVFARGCAKTMQAPQQWAEPVTCPKMTVGAGICALS